MTLNNMKTIMRRRDLKRKYGFPKDIDRNRPIYVAVPDFEKHNNPYSTIIYYNKDGIIVTMLIGGLYEHFAPNIYGVYGD